MDTLKSCLEIERERQRRRKLAFLRTFSGVDGETVLDFLSNFCGENTDNFVRDNERMNAYMQGRFSVMIEIRKQLRLAAGDENQ